MRTPSKKISEAIKAIETLRRARLNQVPEEEASAALKDLQAFIQQQERELTRRKRERKDRRKTEKGGA